MANENTSNAVEYERKRDAITDLKENYRAVKRLYRTLMAGMIVGILLVVGSAGYGIVIDGNVGLPPALFFLGIILGGANGLYYSHVRESKEIPVKKAIRDAEREFKYWSIDNPPC